MARELEVTVSVVDGHMYQVTCKAEFDGQKLLTFNKDRKKIETHLLQTASAQAWLDSVINELLPMQDENYEAPVRAAPADTTTEIIAEEVVRKKGTTQTDAAVVRQGAAVVARKEDKKRLKNQAMVPAVVVRKVEEPKKEVPSEQPSEVVTSMEGNSSKVQGEEEDVVSNGAVTNHETGSDRSDGAVPEKSSETSTGSARSSASTTCLEQSVARIAEKNKQQIDSLGVDVEQSADATSTTAEKETPSNAVVVAAITQLEEEAPKKIKLTCFLGAEEKQIDKTPPRISCPRSSPNSSTGRSGDTRSCSDLSRRICDNLVEKGLLKSKPASIRTDREAQIVNLFGAAALDGDMLSTFRDRRSLETHLLIVAGHAYPWFDTMMVELLALQADGTANLEMHGITAMQVPEASEHDGQQADSTSLPKSCLRSSPTPSVSSSDLSKKICDNLVEKGLLRAKPSFIRSDREARLADVFTKAALDGRRLSKFCDRKSLEKQLLQATSGESCAWLRNVIDELMEIIEKDVAIR